MQYIVTIASVRMSLCVYVFKQKAIFRNQVNKTRFAFNTFV